MPISRILPFREDVEDPLFAEVRDKLESQGIQLNEADLFHIYLEARKHIVYAIERYGGFWKKFQDDDVIDVAHAMRTFFVLIYLRSGHNVAHMPLETRSRSFLLLTTRNNRHIARATSAFLNAMIAELRYDPLVNQTAV